MIGSMSSVTRRELQDGGWVTFDPQWLGVDEARVAMDRLVRTLPLRSEVVTVFGNRHPQPRLTAWHADPGCVYRYSGLTLEPNPWTGDLAALRDRTREACGVDVNSVLINLYRDGSDAMGWHADDEEPLGSNPVIASLSLGAPRRFVLRHERTREKIEYALGGGSLLVMGGTTQHHWRHAVPRTTKPVGPRLNLTWRRFNRE